MAGVRIPVEFDGDFSQLAAGMERSLAGVSQGLTSAGGALTRGLTVPLVGLGTLAAREFAGFESSLTKIENHTSLSRGEIEKLSPAIREVGTTAGLSGTEAADAFFFLQSGLGDSAKAMDALDAAAKGSAVGLGTTEDVSKALVSVMANYGDEAGNATQIMETFGSAAQASSLDADQMAIGLRGIIPQAAQAGIGLDDLAATMAVISPNFNSGAEAGTAMEAALRSIVAPSKEAETMLTNAGTSAEELSEIAGKKGLSGAMEFLGETFEGNQAQLTRMLGSSEAAAAVMGFLGAEAEFVDRTFSDVEKKTFSLDEAFKNLSDDAGFRVTQSIAKMRDTLLDVGAVVLPIVADALEKASGFVQVLADAFTGLSPQGQKVVLAIAAVASAIGPSLLVAGQFAAALGALAGAGGLGAVVQGALKFLGPVGLIAGLFIAAWQSSEPFRESVFNLGETLRQVGQDVLPQFVALGQTLITTVMPQLAAIFATVATNVGTLLAAVVPLIGALISELAPVVVQVAEALVDLLAAVLPVVSSLLSQLLPVIVNLAQTVIPQLIPVIQQVADILGQVLPPAIGLVTELFQVLGPVISALLPFVISTFQTMGAVIGAAITVLSGLITFLTGAFTGDWQMAWTGIQTIFSGVLNAIIAIAQGWVRHLGLIIGLSYEETIQATSDTWNTIVATITTNVTRAIRVVTTAFNTIVSTVRQALATAGSTVLNGWNRIVSSTQSAFNRVVSTVTSAGSRVLAAIRNAWNAATSATSSAFGRIVSTVSSGASRVVSSVRSGFASAVSAARTALSNMVSAVSSGIGRVVSAVASIRGRVQGAVSGFSGALFSAGSNLIYGLIGGIRAAAGAVASAARSVVQNAINAARSALGIASPSKVFAEIGLQSGQGMAQGLEASARLVRSAAERSMTPDLTSRLGMRTSGAARTTSVAGMGVGDQTVILNEYGPRTDSAKRREIDWALKHPTRGRTFESGQLAVV